MKGLLKFIGIIFIILVVLFLARNIILKAAIEGGVGIVTGLQLNMQTFNLDLADTSLQIDDLKIYNPKGFEELVLLRTTPSAYIPLLGKL